MKELWIWPNKNPLIADKAFEMVQGVEEMAAPEARGGFVSYSGGWEGSRRAKASSVETPAATTRLPCTGRAERKQNFSFRSRDAKEDLRPWRRQEP